MERISGQNAEIIGAALDYLPARLRDVAACDFFCADALFAGITTPAGSVQRTPDGRSYRSTAHVLFPYHARDKRATVVLPARESITTVLHELGHVLHWALAERAGSWTAVPRLDPVSEYAKRNWLEEFAEAFTAWFYPARQVDADPYWLGYSRRNEEFFDRLCSV